MTRMEFDKFLCSRRIYLIVAAAVVLEIIFALQMRTVMFEGFHKQVYQHYTSEIAGDYSKEKKAYIEAECEKMQNLLADQEIYKEQYRNDEINAAEYHKISDEIKAAEYRIETLEYLKEKSDYYDSSEHLYSYFYDIAIGDYIAYLDYDAIAMIVVLLLVIPLYTDDYYAGTTLMIRSSKNGRKELLFARLKVAAAVSAIVSILFSAVEFLTKCIRYDLGNLQAKTGSLMIEKTSVMPEFMRELPIWEYLCLFDLSRVVLSVIFGILSVFAAKKCRGNLEAFFVMGTLLFVFLLAT